MLRIETAVLQQTREFPFPKTVNEHVLDTAVGSEPIAELLSATDDSPGVADQPAHRAGVPQLIPQMVGMQNEQAVAAKDATAMAKKIHAVLVPANHAQCAE